jgi:secreted Zn-dependent insulinase-like peptidase
VYSWKIGEILQHPYFDINYSKIPLIDYLGVELYTQVLEGKVRDHLFQTLKFENKYIKQILMKPMMTLPAVTRPTRTHTTSIGQMRASFWEHNDIDYKKPKACINWILIFGEYTSENVVSIEMTALLTFFAAAAQEVYGTLVGCIAEQSGFEFYADIFESIGITMTLYGYSAAILEVFQDYLHYLTLERLTKGQILWKTLDILMNRSKELESNPESQANDLLSNYLRVGAFLRRDVQFTIEKLMSDKASFFKFLGDGFEFLTPTMSLLYLHKSAGDSLSSQDLERVFRSNFSFNIRETTNLGSPVISLPVVRVQDKHKLTQKAKAKQKVRCSMTISSGIMNNVSNYVIYYVETGEDNLQNRVLSEVLTQILMNSVLVSLREEKNVGYIAFAEISIVRGVVGLSIQLSSSNYAADKVQDLISSFLRTFCEEEIEQMTRKEFQEQIASFISVKREKKYHLLDRSDILWHEICEGTLIFDRVEREVAFLSQLKLRQFVSWSTKKLRKVGSHIVLRIEEETKQKHVTSKELELHELYKSRELFSRRQKRIDLIDLS